MLQDQREGLGELSGSPDGSSRMAPGEEWETGEVISCLKQIGEERSFPMAFCTPFLTVAGNTPLSVGLGACSFHCTVNFFCTTVQHPGGGRYR